jgi:hypothetical protein
VRLAVARPRLPQRVDRVADQVHEHLHHPVRVALEAEARPDLVGDRDPARLPVQAHQRDRLLDDRRERRVAVRGLPRARKVQQPLAQPLQTPDHPPQQVRLRPAQRPPLVGAQALDQPLRDRERGVQLVRDPGAHHPQAHQAVGPLQVPLRVLEKVVLALQVRRDGLELVERVRQRGLLPPDPADRVVPRPHDLAHLVGGHRRLRHQLGPRVPALHRPVRVEQHTDRPVHMPGQHEHLQRHRDERVDRDQRRDDQDVHPQHRLPGRLQARARRQVLLPRPACAKAPRARSATDRPARATARAAAGSPSSAGSASRRSTRWLIPSSAGSPRSITTRSPTGPTGSPPARAPIARTATAPSASLTAWFTAGRTDTSSTAMSRIEKTVCRKISFLRIRIEDSRPRGARAPARSCCVSRLPVHAPTLRDSAREPVPATGSPPRHA